MSIVDFSGSNFPTLIRENVPDGRRCWFRLPLAKLVLFNSVAMILCSCFYSSAGPLQLILLLSQAWMAEVWEAVEELEDLKDLR